MEAFVLHDGNTPALSPLLYLSLPVLGAAYALRSAPTSLQQMKEKTAPTMHERIVRRTKM